MIAAISFIRRKPDATLDQYRKHWLNVHGPLAAALPGVRSYVQSHVQHDAPGTNDLARNLRIDGLAQIWFDDEAARQTCYDSDQEVVCDQDSLLWIGASARVVTEFRMHAPLSRAPSGVKQVVLFLKTPDSAVRMKQAAAELQKLIGVNGIEGIVEHVVIKQGASPNFKRERVEVEVEAIYEISYDSAETLKRNTPPFAGGNGIALFEARDHRIV